MDSLKELEFPSLMIKLGKIVMSSNTALFFAISVITVGLIANLVLIIVILKKEGTKSIFNITVLGINDLLFSGSYLILLIIFFGDNHETTAGATGLIVLISTNLLAFTSSLTHALFIAVQRWIAVFFPFKSKFILSRRRCLAGLAFVWIFAVILTVVYFLGAFHMKFATSIILVYGLFLAVAYGLISYRMRTRQRPISHQANQQSELRVLVHSIAITISFTACIYPPMIYLLLPEHHQSYAYTKVNSVLLTVYPLINSVLYFFVMFCKRNKICRATTVTVGRRRVSEEGHINENYATSSDL